MIELPRRTRRQGMRGKLGLGLCYLHRFRVEHSKIKRPLVPHLVLKLSHNIP